MTYEFARDDIERLLAAVGDLLAESGGEAAIVVVGGATLGVMGWVPRTTYDIDVIAQAKRHEGAWVPIDPNPLPQELLDAVERVARDFNLPSDWLNAEVGDQWPRGLPPNTAEDVTWRQYGGLHVGFVGRSALIALKLFASVDQGPKSVHFQDLTLLQPTTEELRISREWVLSQDIGEEFPALVDQVIQAIHESKGP